MSTQIDTKSFFLVSTTDDRAVICDANEEIYVVDDIEEQFNVHRSQFLKAVNTLRKDIVKEMLRVAKDAGFEVETETMLVW